MWALDAVEWAMKADRAGCRRDPADQHGLRWNERPAMILELTKIIADNVSIPVIASGGAGTSKSIFAMHFTEAGRRMRLLAASLFHYKELEIRDLKEYLARSVAFRCGCNGKRT